MAAGLRIQSLDQEHAARAATDSLRSWNRRSNLPSASILWTQDVPDPSELARMVQDAGGEDNMDVLDSAEVPAYVGKIIRTATILSVRSEDVLQAFLAFYCNDHQRRIGYMSMLIVHRDYRRKGLAELLVQESVRLLLQLGFSSYRLEVHKNNLPAIHLYEQLGFKRTGEERVHTLFMEMLLAPAGPVLMNPL